MPDHQERQPHLLTAQLSATLRRRLITSCRSSGGAIGDGAAAASAAVIGDGAAAGGSEPAKLTATGRWAGRRKRPAVDFAQRTSVTIHAGVTMATESAPTGVVISRGRNQPSAARAPRPAAVIRTLETSTNLAPAQTFSRVIVASPFSTRPTIMLERKPDALSNVCEAP